MSFWNEECPARGPGLTHQHDYDDCGKLHERHPDNTCCECGMEPSQRQGPGVIAVVIVRQVREPEPPDEPGGIIDRELQEIFDHYWQEHGGEA